MGAKSRFQGGALEFVTQAVKADIRSGRWNAGEALDIAAIASDLGVSPSPVREALAHLHGERVLDARHRGGYSLPLLQLHELVAEYRFLSLIAQMVANEVRPSESTHEATTASYETRLETFLATLAYLADLPAAALSLSRSTLRLSSYVRAEILFIAGAERHLEDMERAVADERVDQLSRMLEAHFRARIAAAPVIGRYVFEQSKRSGKALD